MPKYFIHPVESNPATFTRKGERMYEHVREGYGRDPRAEEIAARTVYARAKTVPGLVKRNPDKRHVNYDVFYRTGWQDCDNVIDPDDFRGSTGMDPARIVRDTFAQYESEGLREDWVGAHADTDDVERAYEAWRDGWMACATDLVHTWRQQAGRARDGEENPSSEELPPKLMKHLDSWARGHVHDVRFLRHGEPLDPEFYKLRHRLLMEELLADPLSKFDDRLIDEVTVKYYPADERGRPHPEILRAVQEALAQAIKKYAQLELAEAAQGKR